MNRVEQKLYVCRSRRECDAVYGTYASDSARSLETVQESKNTHLRLRTMRCRKPQPCYMNDYNRSITMTGEPAPGGGESFAVRHDRFRDALESTDWDEFSGLTNDEQRIRFVYERMQRCATGPNSSKDGDAALEMKKSGTERFQKSDYRNALYWYSLAALHCPQTEGTVHTQHGVRYTSDIV